MDLSFEKRWRDLVTRLSARFDAGKLDLNAVLFLIGVQELGQHAREFKKDEKISEVTDPQKFYDSELYVSTAAV